MKGKKAYLKLTNSTKSCESRFGFVEELNN